MDGKGGREEPKQAEDPWVASDASTHTLHSRKYKPTSLVGVAIAVDSLDEFNRQYTQIISEKNDKYNIDRRRIATKTDDLNKQSAEWILDDAVRDIVESLFELDVIANIHFTETTFGQEDDVVVPAYLETDSPKVLGPDNLRDKINSYYNIVPVWDYLRVHGDKPFAHHNVMVDDFGGKESEIWRYVGRKSDQLKVIPKGDHVYPLLSLADLTMKYVKQEVPEWNEDAIQNHLEDVTPKNSAFVEARSIDTREDLEQMAPKSRNPAKTSLHYPHPIVLIDRGQFDQDRVELMKIYDVICEYVRAADGCVKFFVESQDLAQMTEEDYLVCLDQGSKYYNKYNNLENNISFDVIGPEETISNFGSS